MANKLINVTQLDTAVDGFASAIAAMGYEQKANLKALAYKDSVEIEVLATDLKTELEGKMTKTKAQELVNEKVGKAYIPGGSKTLATLPALTKANAGFVYNMTEEFTTTADFIEGAGKTYTAGTEVAIVEVEETLVPGTYDASGNLLKSWAQLISGDADVMVANGVLTTPNDKNSRFANADSIVIDSSVTSIGEYAFYGCTNLTTITIPDSVTSIDSAAFWGCTSLTEITIPDGVTSISYNAFGECTNLTTIHYSGTATGAPWSAPNATVDPNAPVSVPNIVYKYNVLSSYIDTTKFASQSSFSVVQAAVQNIQIATNSDIQALIDGLSLDEEVWDIEFLGSGGDYYVVKIKWVGEGHSDPESLDFTMAIKDPDNGNINNYPLTLPKTGVDMSGEPEPSGENYRLQPWQLYGESMTNNAVYSFRFPELAGYTKTIMPKMDSTSYYYEPIEVTYTYTGGAQMITVDTNKITDDELNPDKISYIASNDQNTKTVYIPASKNWSSAINSVILWGMSKDGETEINVTPASYNILANTIFDGNWDTVAAVLNESDYNNVMENEENIKVTFDTAGSDNSDG